MAVADLFTGLYAANAVLAALLHVRSTGEGQHLDIALFDSQVAMLANQAANYFATGVSPTRLGNAPPEPRPLPGVQDRRRGGGCWAVGNDGQFRACCAAMGAPGLAEDPRFPTNALRVANRSALNAVMEPRLAARTTDHWLEAFEAAGVPCGPINDVARVFREPQAAARGLVVEQTRPDLAQPIRSVAFAGQDEPHARRL